MRMKNELKGAKKPKIISDIRDLVKSDAEVYGDKAAYVYKSGDEFKEFSYNRIYEETVAFGTALACENLIGGVAVMGMLHPRYIVAYLAAINMGGYIVPLDPELSDEQTVHFLRHSEVKSLVYTESMNEKIDRIRDQLDFIEKFIPINPNKEKYVEDERNLKFKRMVALGKAALAEGNTAYEDARPDNEKMAALIFTSGSTGTAKGVMLSIHNLTAAINASCGSMSYDDRNTFVSVLPPHHTYEMTCENLSAMNIGCTVNINDSLKHVMKNFSRFKPNTLVLVPIYVETIYKKIWAEAKKKGIDKKLKFGIGLEKALFTVGIDVRKKLFREISESLGGNVKSIVCGGAPLSPQLVKDFYSFGITILEGYGITECAPLVAVNRPGKVKLHSVGQPVEGCQVKIDYTPGEETGEILVKGENVMMGYYKDEEATAAAFTEDGWFRTGDIGYIDDKGYIFITGRKKNVIILSNGKNVFPEEIEEYLAPIDIISEVVVLSRDNAQGEPVITAIAVPNFDLFKDKSDDEIRDAIKKAVDNVNKSLPSYKQIHQVVIRKEPFEKTTSRKIQRFKVK